MIIRVIAFKLATNNQSMSQANPNWTKDELKTYLLIYCANADFTESKPEIDMIHTKVPHVDYEKIHAEFQKDNDYQSIQKIEASLEHHGYSSNERDQLLQEMTDLFVSDGDVDQLEQNLLLGLRHILK